MSSIHLPLIDFGLDCFLRDIADVTGRMLVYTTTPHSASFQSLSAATTTCKRRRSECALTRRDLDFSAARWPFSGQDANSFLFHTLRGGSIDWASTLPEYERRRSRRRRRRRSRRKKFASKFNTSQKAREPLGCIGTPLFRLVLARSYCVNRTESERLTSPKHTVVRKARASAWRGRMGATERVPGVVCVTASACSAFVIGRHISLLGRSVGQWLKLCMRTVISLSPRCYLIASPIWGSIFPLPRQWQSKEKVSRGPCGRAVWLRSVFPCLVFSRFSFVNLNIFY